MGKLRNSSTNNTFGGGKEKIYTSDSGKTYRIRNASTDNVHDGGKEKIITEEGDSRDSLFLDLFELLPPFIKNPIEFIVTLFGIGVFILIGYGIIEFLSMVAF